jgi:hypothetical protein
VIDCPRLTPGTQGQPEVPGKIGLGISQRQVISHADFDTRNRRLLSRVRVLFDDGTFDRERLPEVMQHNDNEDDG